MPSYLDQISGSGGKPALRDDLRQELSDSGYGDQEHSNTRMSFRSQRRMNTVVNFKLREFADRSNWDNPGGIADSIGDKDSSYLNNMSRAQARAVVAIQDTLSKSQLGRAMVDSAHRGHVEFSFGILPDPNTVAGYLDRQRQVVYNLDGDLVNAVDSKKFISNAVVDTAHELGHAGQGRASGSSFDIRDYTLAHRERLLSLRHHEAAATAASVQVAWELGEAGDPGPWQAILEAGADAHAAHAFGALASADPLAVTDGRARRAAHDAWFSDPQRLAAYDDSQTLAYRDLLTALAMQQAVDYPRDDARLLADQIGTGVLSTDRLAIAGAMPDGMNHLTISGGTDLRDPAYAGIDNPRVAEQVAFLDRIAAKFRDGERVNPIMLNGYDAISAKYDGTEIAQERTITGNGIGIPGEPDNPLDQMNPIGKLKQWRQDRQGGTPATTPVPTPVPSPVSLLRRSPGV